MKNLGNILEALSGDRKDALDDKISVVQFNSRTANIGKFIKLIGVELMKRQFGYKPNAKLSDFLDG